MSLFARLALAAALVAGITASSSAQVGPDPFGYYGFSSNDLGGPAYQWIDITASGALVADGDDVSAATAPGSGGIGGPVTLGAPFPFYGSDYTALNPSTNGYISTSPTDLGPDLSNDCPLPRNPSTGDGGRIYPLHDDLVGQVYYQYFATSPRPHWSGQPLGVSVFQWSVEHFPGGGVAFGIEALLYDNGDLVFQYAAGDPEQGSGSTTGIQDPTATAGLTFACNEPNSIQAGMAVMFTRTPPPIDGDGQMLVAKAAFSIDWARHELGSASDSLSLAATFHAGGMFPDLTGASLEILLAGGSLVPASLLDAGGSATSDPGTSPQWSVRIDQRGSLTLKAAGLDLRAATGLPNLTEVGIVDLPLELRVTGAGLARDEFFATPTFVYKSQENKRTKGTSSYRKTGSLSPVFQLGKVQVSEDAEGGHSFSFSKIALQLPAGQPALPIDDPGVSGDLRIELGDADPIEIPYAALRIQGEGPQSTVTYVVSQLDVPEIAKLKLSNKGRSFAFQTAPLAGTGVPSAAGSALLEHVLPVGITLQTSVGPVRLFATVRLRRSSESTGKWSS